MIRTLIQALAVLCLLIQSAPAVLPEEMLDDPKLEERAREISKGIRCLVCQNQSIDDSNAELARDLRIVIRERLVSGDTNQEVRDYLVSRYGEYVLLKPRVTAETAVLWAGPAAIVAGGAIVIFFWFRKRRRSAPAVERGLSAAEESRLQELLDGENAAPNGKGPDGNIPEGEKGNDRT